MLTILAIFIVPLIYLINSYFIGCCFKRLYPKLNSYFLSGLGFFILLAIIFVLTLPVYVLAINFLGYIILLAIMQAFLIFIYFINWRYIFTFDRFDWLLFLVFIILSLLIFSTWFLSNNLSIIIDPKLSSETDFNQWSSLVSYLSKPVDLNTLVWNPKTDFNSGQYVSWNAINLMWIFLFQINPQTLTSPFNAIFSDYGMLIVYSFITSLIITGIFYNYIKNRNYFQIIAIIGIVALTNAPLFLLTKTPINGSAWIIPLSLLIIRLTFDSTVQTWNYRLDFLCAILLVSSHALSIAFIIFNFTIIVVKVLISYLNKSPHVTTSFLIFSFGLIFPSVFLIQNSSQLGALIFVLVLLVIYLLWFFLIRKTKFKFQVQLFEAWMQKKIVWFITIFILVIYAVSILLMFSGGTFNFITSPWIILPNPFLSDLDNISFNQSLQIILNVSFWSINGVIFIFYFLSAVLSKFKIYHKIINWISLKKYFHKYKINQSKLQISQTQIAGQELITHQFSPKENYIRLIGQKEIQKNYFALFSLLVILIIWNPLSTNLANRIFSSQNFDLSWLFFLAVVPSFFSYSLPKSKSMKFTITTFIILISTALNIAMGLGNYLFN